MSRDINSHERWSNSEEDIVRKMLKEGASNWDIAFALRRSLVAVKTRISKLGISRHPEVGRRLAEARERAREWR